MKSMFNNKKRLLLCLLLAIFIVVVGVVVLSFVTTKSIEGDWELIVNPEIAQVTPDEVDDSDRVYYTFSKPDKYGDGKYKTYYDGGVEEGTYKLSEKDGKELINLGTEDLEYKITGSKFIRKAKLIITYPEYTNEETGETFPAEDYVFEQAKAPQYDKESFDISELEIDEKLIGEWVTDERTLEYYMYELSYTQTVEFFDNGVFTIHYESDDLALDRYMYYAYTVNDGKLNFGLVTDKETRYTVSYEYDENGNLVFVEDNTSSSIFADEFFSGVTYYTPDNLPEKSVETTSATEQ